MRFPIQLKKDFKVHVTWGITIVVILWSFFKDKITLEILLGYLACLAVPSAWQARRNPYVRERRADRTVPLVNTPITDKDPSVTVTYMDSLDVDQAKESGER